MCVGPLKNLCHWGPISAIAIIKIVSFTTIHCNGQLTNPGTNLPSSAYALLFLLLSASTIYNFLQAVYTGPGFLSLGWKPSNPDDCQYLQYCMTCKGYKAPRSHHCKKCGRCVMKMDHHCPWINLCVGHKNHSSFTLFLFFAVCGCLQATIILCCSLYYALYRNWFLYHGTGREPVVILGFYMFVFCVFALGLAVGVVLAVGMLLFFQLRAIFRNKTAIEDWIVSKANYRRQVAEKLGEEMEPFVFPYNLGRSKNVTQVLNLKMTPVGDGITWEVASNCDQFSLTKEQIMQKNDKKQRSKHYMAIENYSGHIFPVVHGIRVFCSPPCTDESRMAVHKGERILVTRSQKHWFFGEKKVAGKAENDYKVVKGWFPRCCAVLIDKLNPQNVSKKQN